MAQKPRPRQNQANQSNSAPSSNGNVPPRGGSDRDKIVSALLALLADRSWESIGLADIAAKASVSLSQMRQEFSSPLSILAAHIKDTDRTVLAGDDADMAEETPRERLFDVLMRRLEILAPHQAAIRSLLRSARRNPGLALALNGMGVRSQQWMLTAAGINSSGPKGVIRAQGAALIFAQVLRDWLDDDDPGLARTMAALDRGLSRGSRWAGFLDDLCAIPARCCRPRGRGRRRRPADEAVAEAGAA